jgi:predicted Zn-dependent protease
MMGVPARLGETLWTLLAVAAAIAPGAVAAASDRFVPADPKFVVADLRQAQPDDELRPLLAAWRAAPAAELPAVALATAYLERARNLQEPRYFGRAEAVLAPVATQPAAGTASRRLYAEVLQFRHDFAGATALLDRLLRDNPRDTDARMRRAALRLTRGDFAGARADCAQLAASPGDMTAAGFACLAQSLAGTGDLDRANALLQALPGMPVEPAAQAYLLATRAELAERSGRESQAIADYCRALQLRPGDTAVRAALADLLVQQGEAGDAAAVLAVDRPNIALLVRSVALARGMQREALLKRAHDWMRIETERGDAGHHREAALLALAAGDSFAALAAASRNFEEQRELADVRLLARAAAQAADSQALRRLDDWLRATGFRDPVTENILTRSRRS